jgi:hypothetical protein
MQQWEQCLQIAEHRQMQVLQVAAAQAVLSIPAHWHLPMDSMESMAAVLEAQVRVLQQILQQLELQAVLVQQIVVAVAVVAVLQLKQAQLQHRSHQAQAATVAQAS